MRGPSSCVWPPCGDTPLVRLHAGIPRGFGFTRGYPAGSAPRGDTPRVGRPRCSVGAVRELRELTAPGVRVRVIRRRPRVAGECLLDGRDASALPRAPRRTPGAGASSGRVRAGRAARRPCRRPARRGRGSTAAGQQLGCLSEDELEEAPCRVLLVRCAQHPRAGDVHERPDVAGAGVVVTGGAATIDVLFGNSGASLASMPSSHALHAVAPRRIW